MEMELSPSKLPPAKPSAIKKTKGSRAPKPNKVVKRPKTSAESQLLKRQHRHNFREALITLVEQLPHLFAKTDKDYHNSESRKNGFQSISDKLHELGITASAKICEKERQYLRGAYSKAIRKTRKVFRRTGDETKPPTSWVFEEQMSFLEPHLESRSTSGNYTAKSDVDESEGGEDRSDDEDSDIVETSISQDFDDSAVAVDNSISSPKQAERRQTIAAASTAATPGRRSDAVDNLDGSALQTDHRQSIASAAAAATTLRRSKHSSSGGESSTTAGRRQLSSKADSSFGALLGMLQKTDKQLEECERKDQYDLFGGVVAQTLRSISLRSKRDAAQTQIDIQKLLLAAEFPEPQAPRAHRTPWPPSREIFNPYTPEMGYGSADVSNIS